MQTQRLRMFVVDDDRAVLSLAGTGVTCLDVLRALRNVNPQCEAVLMTGYESFEAAVEALKENGEDLGAGPRPAGVQVRSSSGMPAPLIDVQRDHIVRTLELARGNKAVAARLLGVSRRSFYRQLERHGLHQRVPMGRRAETGQLTPE